MLAACGFYHRYAKQQNLKRIPSRELIDINDSYLLLATAYRYLVNKETNKQSSYSSKTILIFAKSISNYDNYTKL